MSAAYNGHTEVAALLASASAASLRATDKDGWTALQYAAQQVCAV